MAERAVVAEVVQLIAEVTEGTPLAATKRIPDLNIVPSFTAAFAPVMGSGYSADLGVNPGQEWSGFSAGGQLSFNSIIYPLVSAFAYAAPATGGATSKIWTPPWVSFGANVGKTYTLEKGQAGYGMQQAGARFTAFQMKTTPNDSSWTGSGIASPIVRPFTLTAAGITEVAIKSMVPKTFSVFLDSTQGALGTTKLLRAQDFTWGGTALAGPETSINSANNGYVASVQLKPTLSASITMVDDTAGAAVLANMRQGVPFYIRQTCQGPLIDTGTPNHYYSFTGDFCVAVNGNPTYGANMGVVTVTYPLSIIHDAVWGKAFNVAVENAIATI